MKKIFKCSIFVIVFIVLTACGNISGSYIDFDKNSNFIDYIQVIDNKDNLTGTLKEFKIDTNNKIDTSSTPISGQRHGSNFNLKIGNILIKTASGNIKNGKLIISDDYSQKVYTFTRSNQEQLNRDLKNLTSK